MTITEDRHLALEGVNNFRDYGGYAAGGGRVRRGALWRSGQHVEASDADLARIAALTIGTITDLRGNSERELNPCRRHDGFCAEVLFFDGETAGMASHVDAGAGVTDEAEAIASMVALYAGMPYRPSLTDVVRRHFAALADSQGADISLIHCFAGKDRTGFVVALTHHVLGVHPDDAMADFLATNAATEGRRMPGRAAHDIGRVMTDAGRRALGGVRPEYLESAFAALKDSHGGADAYLADVFGVDAVQAEKIRQRFVEG